MLKKRHFTGNTSYEYAVIGGLVAVACITPLFFLGGTISTGMQDTNAKASAGIDNLTSLLDRPSAAAPGQVNNNNSPFQFTLSSNGAVVVNTNGMNIVGAPATAGTGTTLATYVYGALIDKLSNSIVPTGANADYLARMRELGEAIKALAEKSAWVLNGHPCTGDCSVKLGPEYNRLADAYRDFSRISNQNGNNQYADLTNTVVSAAVFSNQLFGFGILKSMNNDAAFDNWARKNGAFDPGNGHNALSGNSTNPDPNFGVPPPDASALMVNTTGGQVIDLANSGGSTPPPPPPAV